MMIFKKYSLVSIGVSSIIATSLVSLFAIRYTIEKISLKEASKPKIISPIDNIKALDDKLKETKNKFNPTAMPFDNKQNNKMPPTIPTMPLGVDKGLRPPFGTMPNTDNKMPPYPPPYGANMPPYPPPMDPAERKLIEEEMNRRKEMMEQYNNPPAYYPPMDNQMPYPYPYPPPYYPEDYDPEMEEEDMYYYEGEGFNNNSFKQNDYKRADSYINENDIYEYEKE